MPTRQGGKAAKKASTSGRCSLRRSTALPEASVPCAWKTRLAMSRPIVVTSMADGSSQLVALNSFESGTPMPNRSRPPHQSWLRRRCGVLTTIDKPLFDLRPPASTDDAPRPPLIPDFLVGVVGPGGVRRNVVVETMGWSEPLYRERKERMHAEMAQVCGPVVMHDFHQPADADQAWRDNVFWRALRDALLAG